MKRLQHHRGRSAVVQQSKKAKCCYNATSFVHHFSTRIRVVSASRNVRPRSLSVEEEKLHFPLGATRVNPSRDYRDQQPEKTRLDRYFCCNQPGSTIFIAQ